MDVTTPLQHVFFRPNPVYGKAKLPNDWEWHQSVPFSDYTLWYIYSGKGELTVKDKTFFLHKGAFIIMRPGETHAAVQDINLPLYGVHMHFTVDFKSGTVPQLAGLLPRFTIAEEHSFIEGHLERLLEIQMFDELWMEVEFDLIMKQLLLYLYRMQYKKTDETELTSDQIKKMKKLVQYINEQSGKNIDYEVISNLTGMSYRYTSWIFTKYMRISLKEYISRVRLEKAKQLLQETLMSITEVAEEMEYADIYSFSRMFKKMFGISPSNYRSQILRSLGEYNGELKMDEGKSARRFSVL